jgi:glycine oxidase
VHTADVVIAGAGIIGLSAALELAKIGLSVTVLERGTAMREASWAAAGMLAAHDPENPAELQALSEYSLSLYPDFLAAIERLSGHRVPLRTSLTLQALGSHSASSHAAAENSLEPSALARFAPGLVPDGRRFIAIDEQSLDPRDLCTALPLATRAAGVTLLEHTAVTGVTRDGNTLRIETSSGPGLTANHYLHCCGAWSASPALETLAPQVEPRKGQMLAVIMPVGAPVLTCVLRTPEFYLVPRGDGRTGDARIVIGATVEDAGFDRTLTENAAEWLLAAAADLWPPIRLGSVTERWSGLRPCTPDALPLLGALDLEPPISHSSSPRQWIATGHYRNGILLAPGTARVLRQLVTGEQPDVDMLPFRPGRFVPVAP